MIKKQEREGKMSVDLPPVPPAVVRFADENQMKDIKANEFWNVYAKHDNYFHGYKVYSVKRKNGTGKNMILYKDKETCKKQNPKKYCKDEVRFGTTDEIKEIIHVYF